MDWCKQKWVNLKAHTIHGRLNRARFFLWGLGYNLLLGVVSTILGVLLSFLGNVRATLAAVVQFAFNILSMVISIFLLIGRLHDLNWSGWMILVPVAFELVIAGVMMWLLFTGQAVVGGPLFWIVWGICLAFVLFLYFKRGTVGPNRFGPDPVDEPWKKEEKKG